MPHPPWFFVKRAQLAESTRVTAFLKWQNVRNVLQARHLGFWLREKRNYAGSTEDAAAFRVRQRNHRNRKMMPARAPMESSRES